MVVVVPAHPGSPGKGAVKRVCVCVCVAVPQTVTIRSVVPFVVTLLSLKL